MDKFLKVIGMTPTVSSVIGLVQRLMNQNEDDEEDDDYDMFYIVEDDHGSVSVTSDDIIGAAAMAFGEESSPTVGTRKSLVGGRRQSRGRAALAGSLMRKNST